MHYIQCLSYLQKKYGSNTVVLYQVGSFFSLFIQKNNEVSNITDIENLSSICNLNIAKKQAYTGGNLDVNSIVSPFPKTLKDIDYWVILIIGLQIHQKKLLRGFEIIV